MGTMPAEGDEVEHPLVLAVETLLRAIEFAERCPESADGSMSLDAAWDDVVQLEKELLRLRGGDHGEIGA